MPSSCFLRGEGKEIAVTLLTPNAGNSGGSYTGRPSESESLWKKIIGKQCAGKLHARFDEGELEIEPFGDYASSLLY